MVVKNIECQNPMFVEIIMNQLTENNINYLLIRNEGYMELHFDNYIYRFFCLKYEDKNDKSLMFANTINNLINKGSKEKKIQPGFRKYNRNLIKNDNFKSIKKYKNH